MPSSPDSDTSESGLIGLNLSKKSKWLIIHYEISDPGSEFEIVHSTQIENFSNEKVVKGEEVTVLYGTASTRGIVIAVSGKRYWPLQYNMSLHSFIRIIKLIL